MNARKAVIAAAIALMLLVGAGVAYASGTSGDGPSGDGSSGDGPSTGPGMDKAKSIALQQVNGQVTATEFQDQEGYYEVEVTRPDGSQVDVHLDKNFNIINVQSDGGGSDSQDGANDGGG